MNPNSGGPTYVTDQSFWSLYDYLEASSMTDGLVLSVDSDLHPVKRSIQSGRSEPGIWSENYGHCFRFMTLVVVGDKL